MAGFYLFSSNNQNELVSALGKVVQNPLPNPLETEVILVQSHGMQRWISLQIAQQLGVFSNNRFLFPHHFLIEVFQKVIPEFQQDLKLNQENLLWKVMEKLPHCLKEAEFAQLHNYLNEGDQLKYYQLSKRIAQVFDQYTLYRPDMLLAWDEGVHAGWQSRLWRILGERENQSHYPYLRQKFFTHLHHAFQAGARIPKRISIFGITSLPPLIMQVLSVLSNFIEIHFFFLNPSREYWADIFSKKETFRKLAKSKDPNLDQESLHLDVGNSLLASYGRTGRSLFQLLMDVEIEDYPGIELFQSPDKEDILNITKSDIYFLQERGKDEETPQTQLSPQDRSIQIHSCHSRMREVEVLYDQLLQTLDQQKGIKPGDILVMAPNIDPYVPLIKSVFGAPLQDKRFPFSIADRNLRQESKVIQYFLNLLELPKSRFGVTEILDFLESEAITERFGLHGNDLDLVQNWVESSQIRWGIDGQHRENLETPNTYENTWEFGIHRILMGFAMPQKESHLFAGILPYDNIEGSNAFIFGRFLEFFECLKNLVQDLQTPRTLMEWANYFRAFIEQFFSYQDEWGKEIQTLRDICGDLESIPSRTNYWELIDFEVIKIELSSRLEEMSSRFGFLGAGVTFCSMLPMRSIPFKLIALLGMNEKDFPRMSKPLSFDLIPQQPQIGDRSPRDDDRYLFLETLLSAQKILYISYVGQSIKDNTQVPPSALISELLDYLEQGFCTEEGTVKQQILTDHPLQAFNSKYFTENHFLRSYSSENLIAARQLAEKEEKEEKEEAFKEFISPLGPPSSEWKRVTISQLVQFFGNPAQYFLQNRLGADLNTEFNSLEETEPFTMNQLQEYQLQEELLAEIIAGKDPEQALAKYRAKGILPLRSVGKIRFQNLCKKTVEFAQKIKPLTSSKETLPPIAIDIEHHDFHILGTLKNLWPDYLLHYRSATVKPKDRLRIWIEQLLLSIQNIEHYPKSSILVGTNQSFRCGQIENPEKYLQTLLDLYWKGLQEPLAIFPKLSLSYLETLQKKGREEAQKKAEKEWLGDYQKRGILDDPYVAKCFQHLKLQSTDYEKAAHTLFAPLLEHQLPAD